MAVNRHITGTAHQGGNFTAGKIPSTTLAITTTVAAEKQRNQSNGLYDGDLRDTATVVARDKCCMGKLMRTWCRIKVVT